MFYEGKELTPTDNGRGYLIVNLRKDGKRKSFLVHRLVAQAFIPNPLGYDLINHKDENPKKNLVTNLEWCNYEYNANYGTAHERQKATYKENRVAGQHKRRRVIRPIYIINENYEAYHFINLALAAEFIGISSTNLTSVLKGRQKTTRGWHVVYADKLYVTLEPKTNKITCAYSYI